MNSNIDPTPPGGWVGPKARERLNQVIAKHGIGYVTQSLHLNRATVLGLASGHIDPRWSTVCTAAVHLGIPVTDWLPAAVETERDERTSRVQQARALLRGRRPDETK